MTPARHFIETAWGAMLVVFDEEAQVFLQLWLPDASKRAQLAEQKALFPEACERPLPKKLAPWEERIRAHFLGRVVNFRKMPLELQKGTTFQRQVWDFLREIPYGKTMSYGDIGVCLGTKGHQAIGSAVGANPFPLVIPCHRVLARGGAPGGFSSAGGLATKERLLALEGVELYKRKSISFFDQDFDLDLATRSLLKLAPELKSVVKGSAPFDPGKKRPEQPLRALAKSVVHQQLSGKAAATIWERVLKLCGDNLEHLLKKSEAELRAAGLSGAKARALSELVAREVPPLSSFKRMSDLEVIETISSYRGFGVWSAQMFLIFNLARMDTFAELDLGLQKGREKVFGHPFTKNEKELREWAQGFAPQRTLLSWYLWRSLSS